MAKAFLVAGRPDPRLVPNTQDTSPLFTDLLRAYGEEDPAATRQKALPIDLVIHILHLPTTNPREYNARRLFSIAVFFAMRSCEYLKNPPGERKSLEVIVGDVVFRDTSHRIIPHSSDPSPLREAANVTLLFRTQKNGFKNATVTQWRSEHPTFCPVLLLADLVSSIRRARAPDTTPISFADNHGGKINLFTATFLRTQIRSDLTTVESWRYGILPSEVGLHSARATTAMALFLHKVPAHHIQYIGRWKSDAFLSYIRDQVLGLHQGLSNLIATHTNAFNYGFSEPRPLPTTPTINITTFSTPLDDTTVEIIHFPVHIVPT